MSQDEPITAPRGDAVSPHPARGGAPRGTRPEGRLRLGLRGLFGSSHRAAAEVAGGPGAEVAERPVAEAAGGAVAEVAGGLGAEVAGGPAAEVAEGAVAEVAGGPAAEVAGGPAAGRTEVDAFARRDKPGPVALIGTDLDAFARRDKPGPVALIGTDLYAFVSPDKPGTVTLIANYLPRRSPAEGPNFCEFGSDVLYEIHVDNNGDGRADVTYRFRFSTTVRDEDTSRYNTGPIESLDSPNWNRRQFYTVTRVDGETSVRTLGRGLPCPPGNIGPLATPRYPALAAAAVHDLGGGRAVFAGPRAEGCCAEPGWIFDPEERRPFATAHAHSGLGEHPGSGTGGRVARKRNVHSIALQVPVSDLTRDGWSGTVAADPRAVIGVWTTASRAQVRLSDAGPSSELHGGPFAQVSRLGNPVVSEIVIPTGKKDYWNTQIPADDKQFARYVADPELARLLPDLYPGALPRLDELNRARAPRADLEAVLLTGIPSGPIAGFQNYTGPAQADMLRLNTAIEPSGPTSRYGLLGGDLAGFPNGRRVGDDVLSIELRAVAGATYPLVDKSYLPDAMASDLTDGPAPADLAVPYLASFPYLGVPHSGYGPPAQ
jgi:Domain of unknown function (DUF4331)